jgi:N-methylhydantoinase A
MQARPSPSNVGSVAQGVGIDIGGIFADLVILDPRDGRASIWKEFTTPDNPSRSAVQGLKRVLESP